MLRDSSHFQDIEISTVSGRNYKSQFFVKHGVVTRHDILERTSQISACDCEHVTIFEDKSFEISFIARIRAVMDHINKVGDSIDSINNPYHDDIYSCSLQRSILETNELLIPVLLNGDLPES